MSHFAKVVDGYVVNVLVAEKSFFEEHIETEPCEWVQTSYNILDGQYIDNQTGEPYPNQADYINDNYPERKRKQFAVQGMIYDKERDMFYLPKPLDRPSWRLNYDQGKWEAPIPKPTEVKPGYRWTWDEEVYEADSNSPKTEGWVLQLIE